jgi:hypothetical protein
VQREHAAIAALNEDRETSVAVNAAFEKHNKASWNAEKSQRLRKKELKKQVQVPRRWMIWMIWMSSFCTCSCLQAPRPSLSSHRHEMKSLTWTVVSDSRVILC